MPNCKNKNKIQLSDHFNFARLLRYTLPSIVMMVFTSLYGVVDGLFVSNYCDGNNAIAAVNIVWPLIIIIGSFGFMFGAGGCAEISRAFGQKDDKKAKQYFTSLVLAIAIIGIILSTICLIFLKPLMIFLSKSDDEELIKSCVDYGTILISCVTFFMLATSFQNLFVAAEKPTIGFAITLVSGIANMVLDYLFIKVFAMGIRGAALATAIGYAIGGIIPIIYFLLPNKSILRFVKTKAHIKMLLRSCGNGSSEMVSAVSSSIVSILFNMQMMTLAGTQGVASISIIMYVNMVFVAILIGFSIGSAPIVSYNYGAANTIELKNIYYKSIIIVVITSLAMCAFSQAIAKTLVGAFASSDPDLYDMTVHGFKIYAIAFLFSGTNIFSSSFFTALCNGIISAIISFIRSLLLPIPLIFILPILMNGVNGVWVTHPIVEFVTALISIAFLLTQSKKYGYA